MASEVSVSSLLTLPLEILSRILAYLMYDEISNKRLVCRQFNDIAKQLLNCGFTKVTRQQQDMHKKLRSQLPRRESERRVHPLARKSDILDAIETRLSLLNMTYNKYIEAGLCCFIPGKVLDELEKVMRVVEKNQCPPRANELLQELRDISSMAMEHFDEKIVPVLKTRSSSHDKTPRLGSFLAADLGAKALGTTGCMGLVVRQATRPALLSMRRELTELSSKVAEQQKKLQEHEKALAEKEQKIISQEHRLSLKLAQLTKLQNEVNRQKKEIRRLSLGVSPAVHSTLDSAKTPPNRLSSAGTANNHSRAFSVRYRPYNDALHRSLPLEHTPSNKISPDTLVKEVNEGQSSNVPVTANALATAVNEKCTSSCSVSTVKQTNKNFKRDLYENKIMFNPKKRRLHDM